MELSLELNSAQLLLKLVIETDLNANVLFDSFHLQLKLLQRLLVLILLLLDTNQLLLQ